MSTSATTMSTTAPPRSFIPALEGMRGLAALGVLVTHVAFQTGATHVPVLGRIWGRFDLAVAVFFALSGFLLWRSHAGAARGMGPAQGIVRYWISRATRILPAYWVAVAVVLTFLPTANASYRTWWANLGLVQVFVPLTLTDGLTQMWSLSVEVAFYLVLPLLAFALVRLRGPAARLRVPAILALIAVSLTWAFVPVSTPGGIHHDNWLPGYLPWFGAGMLLAELAVSPPGRMHRWAHHRVRMFLVAAVAFALTATDLAGPEGLVRPEPWQYAVKMALGAVISFALMAPLVLSDTSTHRYLASPLALAVGRWSYGIFIWHLAVLSIVFPVFGLVPFTGHFVYILFLTTVMSVAVASASYALVEEPARRAVKRWEARARSADRPSGSTASPVATSASSSGN
ncbi:probable acyltransferase [Rhodococcus jostii RHA1]|jgi:peptidoglycan/LPS O-acetylase OafA/YrhL|uniref:Probable acyltransferase n=1 Tax=Rhodococcus jostii (strain RHA1) TaxID=101510 RepID=Q0S664_RHOJR|nr:MULTISPECIES: acyltransferase [Rhodococcus]ABG96972.1 probable acyltransferase [Rhodococcus jostii RHA1]